MTVATFEKEKEHRRGSATEVVPRESVEGQRLRRWAGRLSTFFFGQGLVQALNLLTGFFLVRWLTVEDYAAFSLVTGLQGTVAMLVDVGLGGSIVALLAGRTDKNVLGDLIRSTRFYRDRMFVVLLPVILIGFPLLAFRQGFTPSATVFLVLAILATLYFESWTAFYSVPLLVHQELSVYYRVSSLIGATRLGMNAILHALSVLSAGTTVWLASLGIVAQGWLFRRHAAVYIAEPAVCDPSTNQSVLSYIRPLIPSTIFFALQGQISVLLISWFGEMRSIAEVGALGRLAQIFVMLGAFNTMIVAPNIARIPRSILAPRYGQILGGACGIALLLFGVSVVRPDELLWVLGRQYGNLRGELVWTMGAACLAYLTGVMWTMHSARKWIFRRGVWIYIVSVVVTQIVCILLMDLSTTRNVLRFSVFVAAAALVVQVGWALYGFLVFDRRDDRTASSLS